MALVTKTNPVGIDYIIDKIQKALYNFLTTDIGFTKYESYHRANKNYKGEDLIAELFTTNGDYVEVLFDDNQNLSSFFLASDKVERPYPDTLEQEISIIFQGNLKTLFPSIAHRPDEELKAAIVRGLQSCNYSEYVSEITTGVDNVYSGLRFNGDLKEHIRLDDMSYFHVLRVDMKVQFNIDICKTSNA